MFFVRGKVYGSFDVALSMRGATVNPFAVLDRSVHRMWIDADTAMMALIYRHEQAVLNHIAQHERLFHHHQRHNTYHHPANMPAGHILRGRL